MSSAIIFNTEVPQKCQGIASTRAASAVLRAPQKTKPGTKTCAKNPDNFSPNDLKDELLELKLGQ